VAELRDVRFEVDGEIVEGGNKGEVWYVIYRVPVDVDVTDMTEGEAEVYDMTPRYVCQTRPFPKVGEIREGAKILAAHQHGAEGDDRPCGVVLGTWPKGRGYEYIVWTVDPEGNFGNGTYRFDATKAMNIYMKRVASRLYGYYNEIAPTITYMEKNDQ
jgi:hypothetical protein